MNRIQRTRLNTLCSSLRQRKATPRSGAVMVETAIILSVYLLLIIGTFDLGIATFRYNTISQAARQGARKAIVHGKLAPPTMAPWGPATYNGTASDGSVFAQAVSPMLAGFPLNNFAIKVEWLDGDNLVQQRVRFTVSTTHQPILTSVFSNSSYPQSAASTMPIAH
jgi:Flp pilus assembly protein TadG